MIIPQFNNLLQFLFVKIKFSLTTLIKDLSKTWALGNYFIQKTPHRSVLPNAALPYNLDIILSTGYQLITIRMHPEQSHAVDDRGERASWLQSNTPFRDSALAVS